MIQARLLEALKKATSLLEDNIPQNKEHLAEQQFINSLTQLITEANDEVIDAEITGKPLTEVLT